MSCQRIHLLWSICGHALLSTGAGAFFPGDYRGVRNSEGKLKHLRMNALTYFTLAYDNERRPWELYHHVFLKLVSQC